MGSLDDHHNLLRNLKNAEKSKNGLRYVYFLFSDGPVA